MKVISSIFRHLYPPNFPTEEENRKARILFFITGACLIGLVIVLGVRIVGLGSDSNVIIPLFVSLLLLSFSHILLLLKRFKMASYALLISLSGLCGYLLYISDDGYHDTVLFAVPGLLIIAGILLKKWEFYVFTTLTLISIAILVVLENSGIYKTKFSSLVSPYDGIDIIFIIAITAVSVRILTDSLIKSLQRVEENEQALQESERKYREIFNSSSDGIIIRDSETTVIVDANLSAASIYGYTTEEMNGLNPIELSSGIKPYDKDGAKEYFKRAKKEGPQIFEWQAKRKNGELFWIELALKFSKIGNSERFISVVRDITERKRMNEVLIQNEKMLSIGGIAAGMAHEINNPLAGVIQNANLLSRRLTDKKMPANVRAAESARTSMDAIFEFMESRSIPKTLKSITGSGMRIASLVESMLSFARKSDSSFSGHSLADLLDRVIDLASSDFDVKKKYDFKSIKIIKEFEDNLPMVACESGKIQQVFLNILNNGVYAMFKKKASENNYNPEFVLRISHENKSNMLRIEIEDNGPGMDKEVQSKIFEPFFTTKPLGEGTGLGLSVSYFIISENHKGTMRVESKLGKWTKFIIRLPIERKTSQS